MAEFNELGLSPEVLDAVARLGYEMPTPVQEQAIPLVLKGRDLIAAAKTGTGKTAAFSLPALDGLGHAKGGQGPLMLVVTPTRELAQQIGEVCAAVAVSTHHRIATVVGGLSYEPQIQKLKHGTDVLIATPGRLVDLMDQGAARLGDVEVLVLDEADRMLDMGFLPSMRKIIGATPASRQTLLFSATIDRSIMGSVGKLLHDPAMVEIAHKGETADTVEQFIVRAPQTLKPALLKAVLAEKGHERVIVFARTRSRADATCRRLKKAGYTAEAIHSDRSQNQRRRALDNFMSGATDVLVATDVLARGIYVESVDHVINYDLPTVPEDYVHRIGRTGRAGEEGWAISFVSPETEDALRDIQKLIKREIPEMEIASFDEQEALAEAAAHATRKAARTDPEIAQAAREAASRPASAPPRRARRSRPRARWRKPAKASRRHSPRRGSPRRGLVVPPSRSSRRRRDLRRRSPPAAAATCGPGAPTAPTWRSAAGSSAREENRTCRKLRHRAIPDLKAQGRDPGLWHVFRLHDWNDHRETPVRENLPCVIRTANMP